MAKRNQNNTDSYASESVGLENNFNIRSGARLCLISLVFKFLSLSLTDVSGLAVEAIDLVNCSLSIRFVLVLITMLVNKFRNAVIGLWTTRIF